MPSSNSFPTAGLCSLTALPEPYQMAFRQGSAHHLPGKFLPAQTDWFIQFFMLPFIVLYASPLLLLAPALINQAIRQPGSYLRFGQRVMQQSPLQIGLTLLLGLLIVVLIAHCTYQAWDLAQSLYRTWHIRQMRQRGEHGYGLVLLSHAVVGRLVDNLGRHNCLWLPRQAIADITWQRVREEGAKRSRWVDRTRISYVSATGEQHWLTLRGEIVQLGYASGDSRGDRALYETLISWWKSQPSTF